MGGYRTFTAKFTEAQIDVLRAAVEQAVEVWKPLGRLRSSDVKTLSRVLETLEEAWENGTRG